MPEISNFIIPESNFAGLYKTGDDLQRNRQLNDAAKQRTAANKNALGKWAEDYADPKEHLSGTPTDPETIRRYGELLNTGYEFIKKNPDADQNMLSMALAKPANELYKYTEMAKVIKNKVSDNIKAVPDNSGYDKFKLQQKAIQNAWYNPDGTVKTLDQIDPDQDYVAKVVQDSPEDVTNNSGIDNWMKGQRMVENSNKLKTINPNGGYTLKNVTTNAYPFAVPDVNQLGNAVGGFVPQYEVAHNNSTPIIHEFQGQEGEKTSAPIRMVTPQIYKSILANSPGTADWLRGQIITAIKSGEYKDGSGRRIDINSPQADMLGKAIIYDELKARGLGGMKEVIEQKANPSLRTTVNVNPSGNKAEVSIDDIFNEVNEKSQSNLEKFGDKTGLPLIKLSARAQKVLIKYANDLMGKGDELNGQTQEDIFVKKERDGTINLMQAVRDADKNVVDMKVIAPIDFKDVNIPVQVNAKRKGKVVEIGNLQEHNLTPDKKGKFD